MLLDILGIVLPVLATIVAAFIAKRQASRELELKFDHLQKQWEHERELATESRFSEMAAAVSNYLHTQGPNVWPDALAKVAAVRVESDGNLAAALDRLYDALDKGTRSEVTSALSSAINLYRNEDHQKAPK